MRKKSVKIFQKILSNLRQITFFVAISNSILTSAQTSPTQEHQIKAVFLFNFTQFVEWPANAFSNPEMPLVIGVLGKNPFGNYLTDAVSNEKVNNHPLVVQYFNSVEEVKTCHILFVNLPQNNKIENLISSLKGRNILTVSDANDFLKDGGVIRFFTKNNKIQLQINTDAAKEADLTISSKLLRLAEIVVPKK